MLQPFTMLKWNMNKQVITSLLFLALSPALEA